MATPAASLEEARAARKELTRIERRLARLAEEEARLHADLAAVATDYVRVAELDGRLRAVTLETAELEDAWLAAAETTD
jgi:ATP-binding cassette subfamily F protein uup